MKILVLGATGRTGRFIVSEGLSRGHEITALVRESSPIHEAKGLTIQRGTPTSLKDVALASDNCDAILVALNNPRSSDAPWAKPLTKDKILTKSAQNIIEAGKVKRVVFLSALGVSDSFYDVPWIMRFLIRRTNLSYAYEDHNSVESVFRNSDLDWTLVRATGLSNQSKQKNLVVGSAKNPKPGMMINRKTVAGFMLDCMESGDFIRATPTVSER